VIRRPLARLARLAGLALLAAATPAAAWQPLDPTIPRWPSLPVGYHVNPWEAPAAIAPVAVVRVEQGFAAWSAPGCTVWAAQDLGVTLASYDKDDGENVLRWIGDAWPAELGAADAIIGFTIPTWDESGAILDADTLLNAVGFCWNDTGDGGCVDALSILTHEEGHFLGLGHTDVPAATMFASYQGGVEKRTLDPDDIAGACALYPPGGTTATSSGSGATGCQGCANDAVLGACAPEQDACSASQPCQDYFECISACSTDACIDACTDENPEGAALRAALTACLCAACASECAEACESSSAGAGGGGSPPAPSDPGGCSACTARPRDAAPAAAPSLLLAAGLGALARRRLAPRARLTPRSSDRSRASASAAAPR
jgi:hypothetical protein